MKTKIAPNHAVATLLAAAFLIPAASAQNVGIGTTTPRSKLSVNGTTASGGIAVGDATYTSTLGTIAPLNGAIIQGNIGVATVAPICQLDVRGTTKIMATTGVQTGEFWSGTANVDGFEVITFPEANNAVTVGIQRAGQFPPLHLSKPTGAAIGDFFLSLIVGGNLNGSISATAGGVSFNTTSDERLKENIQPSSKGLADVMKIQVSDYNYKASPDRAETGFIAQQLHTVFPNAVSPGGEDPTENPWTVDYGRVTPVLVKATQELAEKVAALEAENAKLKTANEKLASVVSEVEALKQAVAALRTQDEGSLRTVSTAR